MEQIKMAARKVIIMAVVDQVMALLEVQTVTGRIT